MALDRLYFRADNGKSGWELFSTAGTISSTGLLADIEKGPRGSWPQVLTQWQGRMWFTATTQAQGREIWSTDGTQAGTRILLDIGAGAASGIHWLGNLIVATGQHRAWFAGKTAAHGTELWVTDGSAKGTKMVTDLTPGTTGSSPMPRLVASGQLFLSIFSMQFGEEPFALDPGASAYSIGEASGPMQLRLSGTEPILGSKSHLQLRNIKARSTVALVFGAAATRPRSIMPGTISYVDPATLDVLAGYASTGTSLQASLQVPNDAQLLGVRLALQAYAMRGIAKPISSSNGVVLKVGR
ncbi:MAG: hypothetical protein CSA62_01580 [Planctomycetota bacterium]|nr:MAG: hypothetical protein CSA62_01580 [Planctomycetota bacterium]